MTTTIKSTPRSRIRDVDIATVRGRADILAVIGETVELTPAAGGTMKGRCPFHDETVSSFHVNPTKGIYFCHGCGAGGDAITFVMTQKHLSFTEAVAVLAASAGVTLRYDKAPKRRRRTDINALADRLIGEHSGRDLDELVLELVRRYGVAAYGPHPYGTNDHARAITNVIDAVSHWQRAAGHCDLTTEGMAEYAEQNPF